MRVVLDTNVLVSSLLTNDGAAAGVFDQCILSHDLLVSQATFAELIDVLTRPKFIDRLDKQSRINLINYYRNHAIIISISTSIADCRDKKDNKFLELAIDGKADLIVSGDEDLLVLHPWRNIRILSPNASSQVLMEAA